MTPLRQRMLEEMKLRNLSENTIKAYISAVATYALFYNKCPSVLNLSHIREYKLHLIENRKLHKAHVANAALRFLYTQVLKREWSDECGPVPKLPKKLPAVLSLSEVARLFDAFTSRKYKVLFMTIYAGGLRISEATTLRFSDIDHDRKEIKIREAKGGRDRFVMLSPTLWEVIKDYRHLQWFESEWLFPGRPRTKSISAQTAASVLKVAVKCAGIKKNITPHSLRHSFATHLLESGTDIRVLQILLGHKNINTTTIYARMSREAILNITSPLDIALGVKTEEKKAG